MHPKFSLTPFLFTVAMLPLLLAGCGGDDPAPAGDESVAEVAQIPVESVDANNSQNQYVPADTFMYAGTVEPFSLVDWKQKFPDLDGETVRQAIMKSSQAGGNEQSDVDDRVLSYVAEGIANVVDDPEQAMRSYGIDANALNWAFFMSGVVPVLRFELADKAKFLQQIPEFESKTGLTATTQYMDDIEVRLYEDATDPDAPLVALAIVEDSALLTFTEKDQSILRTTLGLDPVPDNIASTTTITELKNKYNYTSDIVGYVDFTRLSSMLTDSESNAGKRLAEVVSSAGTSAEIAVLNSPQCSAEITQIAENWPRLVMGYRSFDVVDRRFELKAHVAAELQHPKLLKALTALRGHIPHSNQRSESPMFVGLGIDAGQISGFINTVTSLLEELEYQCPALAQLNELQTSSIPMLGGIAMFTFSSMVEGIRGVGVNLFSKDGDSYDGAISVATDNPEKLVNLAQSIPQIGVVSLPEDGTAVNLDEILSTEMLASVASEINLSNSQIAQRGQQLVVFGGENGTALAQHSLESVDQDNGFLAVSVNLEKLKEMNIDVEASSGALDDVGSEFTDLFPDSNVGYLIDFTEHGIEFETLFDFETR